MNKKYIITCDAWNNGKKMFLCWQPYDYDIGYFWTWEEYILNCLKYNECPHKFIFSSKEEARKLAKDLNLYNYDVEIINI